MAPIRNHRISKTSLIAFREEKLKRLKFASSSILRLLLVALLSMLMVTPAIADIIAGDARVIDGRTLEVDGQKIRLWGIDSPDLDQTCSWSQKTIPCGRLAQGALKDLIIGASIRCETRGPSETAQHTAVCFADSYDIGANLVHTGWALAQEPTNKVYRETEQKARAAKRGLWRGKFERPAQWRAKNGGSE